VNFLAGAIAVAVLIAVSLWGGKVRRAGWTR
jgi:Flp pilus assembly pilin Flp